METGPRVGGEKAVSQSIADSGQGETSLRPFRLVCLTTLEPTETKVGTLKVSWGKGREEEPGEAECYWEEALEGLIWGPGQGSLSRASRSGRKALPGAPLPGQGLGE